VAARLDHGAANSLTIELASVAIKQKPWGSIDLLPWTARRRTASRLANMVQRADRAAPDTALLLKLCSRRSAIHSGHPDDALRGRIGLANGKTEAWYFFRRTGRTDRLGLNTCFPRPNYISHRGRFDRRYGAVATRVRGDVVFVRAGTIHAIGAGIVLRSSTAKRRDLSAF